MYIVQVQMLALIPIHHLLHIFIMIIFIMLKLWKKNQDFVIKSKKKSKTYNIALLKHNIV